MVVSASVVAGGEATARDDSSAGRVAGRVEVMTTIVSETLEGGKLVMVSSVLVVDKLTELLDELAAARLLVTLTTLTVAVVSDVGPMIVAGSIVADCELIVGSNGSDVDDADCV